MSQANRKFTFEESSLLISAVLKRPVLWDSTSQVYKDVVAKKVAWQEISHDLFVSVETIMTRWKSLRDTYSKERKKSVGKSGQAATLKKKWAFYEGMSFLNKCLEALPTVTNWGDEVNTPPEFQGLNMIALSDESQNSEIMDLMQDKNLTINDFGFHAASQLSQLSGDDVTSPSPTLSTQMSTPSPVPSPLMSPPSTSNSAVTSQSLLNRNKKGKHPDSIDTTEDRILSLMEKRQENRSAGQKEITPEEHFYMSVAQRAAKLSMGNRLKLERIVIETLCDLFEEESL